jgi:hypothetical protein
MSNASIASRILEVVLAFESGRGSPFLVNESIELHSPAFAAIPRELIDRLNHLGLTLLKEDLSEFEREQLGWPNRTAETTEAIKGILIQLGASPVNGAQP